MNCVVEYHFDVWGNSKDGWEVNESRREEMTLNLHTNRALLKDLRTVFIIPRGMRITDYGTYLTIDLRNGRPFITVYFT